MSEWRERRRENGRVGEAEREIEREGGGGDTES